MSEIKARLIGAITVMDEAHAQKLWDFVERLYSGDKWDLIEEVEPDEIDLQMIQEAQADPECSSLASAEEIRSILG